MLSERLEEWAHGYEAQGVQKGMQQGEALALQRLLSKRFCVIPPDVLAKISGATPAQIDAWLDQVLDAKSLGDMFGTSK
ncbi:MAG: DUF4351 domain-containing protein [Sulfuricellaceae bacterium]